MLEGFKGGEKVEFDTTTGPKREAASYAAIAADMGLAPRQVLFVSDVGAELDAARAAGMATALAVRPGNREPGGLRLCSAERDRPALLPKG